MSKVSQRLRPRVRINPFTLAMVEYSLDLQIPEHVWDHPILQEMSKAVIDIMTWPNVRRYCLSATDDTDAYHCYFDRTSVLSTYVYRMLFSIQFIF